MARKEIGSIFDRNNRNAMNDNFEYLFNNSARMIKQLNDLVLESGQSDTEVVHARGGKTVLNDRFVDIENELLETKKNKADKIEVNQLADDKADKSEINRLSDVKADRAYTDSEIQKINNRVNDIITTPSESINEQEIIDARDTKTSLGQNIRSIRNIAETGIFNEVLNGNFYDGTNGFFFNLGSGNVAGDTITLTSNGTTTTNGTQLTYVINEEIPSTGKWLVYAEARTLDDAASLIIGVDSNAGGFVDTNINHAPINNQWYKMTHIVDFSDVDVSDNTGKLRVRISSTYPSGQNNGKKVEVRNIIAINLSKAFGAGKEMDSNKIVEIINDVGGYFHEDVGGKLTKSLFNDVERINQGNNSKLVNFIDNGDFSKDLTEWNASNGANLSIDKVSKAIVIKKGGSSGTPQALQYRDEDSYTHGDKLFFKADFWANHSDVSKAGFYFYSDLFGEHAISHTIDVERSKWVNIFCVYEVPSNWTGRLRFNLRGVFKPESNEDASLRVRDVVGVNLTKLYGKGNEPTAEKFNDFIGSFESHISNPSNKEFNTALSRYVFNNELKGGVRKRPLVCLTIDDGTETDYTVFYPELLQRGMVATSFIIGSRVGTDGYITLEQMKEMKLNGWGIEGHTYEHKRLTEVSDEEVRRQIVENNNFFDSVDFPKPNHIALPYGVVNESGRSIIAEYRKTIRNVSGTSSDSINDWDSIDFQRLNAVNIDTSNVQGVIDKIDEAIERNAIIILFGHRVGDDSYQTPLTTLTTILDYIEDKGLQTYTMHEMYKQVLDYKKQT